MYALFGIESVFTIINYLLLCGLLLTYELFGVGDETLLLELIKGQSLYA